MRSAWPLYADGVFLRVDDKEERLTVASAKISVQPGAGGLQTLRLEYEFEGPTYNAGAGTSHRLDIRTTTSKTGSGGVKLWCNRE